MQRDDTEAAECWYARAVRDFQTARENEDRHWRRLRALEQAGITPALDKAYLDAVDRTELAQYEVSEAETAMERERPI
jgi:hypothetical protein